MTDLDIGKIIIYIHKLTFPWLTRGFISVTKQLRRMKNGIMTLVSGFGKEQRTRKANLLKISNEVYFQMVTTYVSYCCRQIAIYPDLELTLKNCLMWQFQRTF